LKSTKAGSTNAQPGEGSCPPLLSPPSEDYIPQDMIKELTAYVITTTVGIACLGLLALVMARDTFKDSDVGPFDE